MPAVSRYLLKETNLIFIRRENMFSLLLIKYGNFIMLHWPELKISTFYCYIFWSTFMSVLRF